MLGFVPHPNLRPYKHNGYGLGYICCSAQANYGEAVCQSLAGRPLEEWVSRWVLQALEPAALELSLTVAEDVEAERQQLHQHWRQRLDRAHYAVERAARQYQAVEPEHRLVARTLERQWEEALAAEAALRADYERFQAEQPATLSASEREAIRQLASDIPALWRAPTTTAADRQAIIRQLVERVVVTVQGQSETVDVQVHWLGGYGTQATLIRPVARGEQLSYYLQLLARVATLFGRGQNTATIAATLNAEGWRPAKRRETFNADMVRRLLARQGLRTPRRALATTVPREVNEWTLQELVHQLAIPYSTLYVWLHKGVLTAQQETSLSHPIWLIQADATELKRLRSLHTAPKQWQRPSDTLSS